MKNRKHKSDLVILFTTLGLMALGLIIIYAIGPMRANVLNNTYGSDYDSNYFFLGQLRSVVLSVVAFFIAFKCIKKRNIHQRSLHNYERFCGYGLDFSTLSTEFSTVKR